MLKPISLSTIAAILAVAHTASQPVRGDETSSGQSQSELAAREQSEQQAEIDQSAAVPKSRPWLGIALKKVDGDLAAFLGDKQGALIDHVHPQSPASKAGLQPGDVVLNVDGQAVNDPKSLMEVMKSADLTKELELTIRRRSGESVVKVLPETRPAEIDLESQWLKDLDEAIPFDQLFSSGSGDRQVEVLRLGHPSILRIPGDLCALACGDLNIQVSTKIDGQDVQVKVVRTEGQEPEITIVRGDQVQKISKEELGQLPDALAQWLQVALSQQVPQGLNGLRQLSQRPEIRKLLEEEAVQDGLTKVEAWVRQLEGRQPSDLGQALKEGLDWGLKEGLQQGLKEGLDQALQQGLDRAQSGAEIAKELAANPEVQEQVKNLREQIKAQVQTALKQAREHAQQAQETAQTAQQAAEEVSQSQEVAELKQMVDQLRKEVAELLKEKSKDKSE